MEILAILLVLSHTGWGLILGSLLAATLVGAGLLILLACPHASTRVMNIAYWAATAFAFVTLHVGYISEDNIGQSVISTIGFYCAAAAPSAMGFRRCRSLLSKIQ